MPYKISKTCLCFSIIFVQHKENGARLLPPEVECESGPTNFQNTEDLVS